MYGSKFCDRVLLNRKEDRVMMTDFARSATVFPQNLLDEDGMVKLLQACKSRSEALFGFVMTIAERIEQV